MARQVRDQTIEHQNQETFFSDSKMSIVSWCLSAILVLALCLRVWGINFGLPYILTYDEIHEVVRALKLGAGEFDWDGFGKGGLYYILFVEYGLLYIVSKLLGWVADTRDFAMQYLQDPTSFYLAGRLTVAVMGTLTCWVVFCIGRRLYNVWVGLGAALIGATAYYHAYWAHFINVDIGLTLALWTSILAYLKYEASSQRRWLLAAGAFGAIAIAFKLPGGIVLPLLLIAIGTSPVRRQPLQMIKASVLAIVALVISLTIVAPEWLVDTINLNRFSNPLAVSPDTAEEQLKQSVNLLTIYRDKNYWGYVETLFAPHNILLTLSALLGMGLAFWQRHRWDLIWVGLSLVFIAVMSLASRSTSERYLLPIMPCLWLLSMRAIHTLSRQRLWPTAIGLACVIALPLGTLIYHNYLWTKPDTRIIAKRWIETHIPSGAKILIDGQRYRLTMSPPLHPDDAAVARRLAKAEGAERVSRGVSLQTLGLYADAMSQIKGPRYDLHSTVWGQALEQASYYVDACFDYVITSSSIIDRYRDAQTQQLFPKSAQFYQHISRDSRFNAVYSIEPKPWDRLGPTIVVYRVEHNCR